MPTKLLTHAAALLLGAALAYLAWGRTPPNPEIQAAIDRADRAEALAAQNTRIAAHWIGLAHGYRLASDSFAKLAQKPRLIVRERAETAWVALSEGDTAKAVAGLLEAVGACQTALTLDSLALTACQRAGQAKDAAIAAQSVALDSLRAANRGSVGVLRRVRDRPWSLGPTYGAAGWGLQGGRDLQFLVPMRVMVEGTAGDGGGVRVGVALRF